MPAVSFPMSSTPGLRPGEGEGRLINAYTEKAGDTFYIRRTPGLVAFANTGKTGPRGLIDVNGTIYAAYTDSVVKVAPGGAVTVLSGTLPGSDGVTFARNNKVTSGASTPDLVAVRESGAAYLVSTTAVSAYPDADLPATNNSVSFLDGFLIYTLADGRIFASELNSTDVNALSFATAEAQSDGLLRGIAYGGLFYAMGQSSIEPWRNIGASPFPLQRSTSIIPVGILTTMAVAGFEPGYDRNPYFVAHDGTVRALTGYEATPVSTPDVEAFIARSTVSTLEASVYTAKGKSFWVLSSDQGTWELNVTTGLWHERKSEGSNRWRGSRSVKIGNQWIVGDKLSTQLLAIDEDLVTELGAPVTWTAESTPMMEYPVRIAIPAAFGHFTRADGVDVEVSWSLNGGQTWSNPLTRSLEQADRYPIRVNRLGLSTHHGLRLRYSSSSTADFSCMGASVPDPQLRRP
jgi:hypothetical protein